MSQVSLFGPSPPSRHVLAGGGWFVHHPGWLGHVDPAALFTRLREELPWEQRMWDQIPMPRLETLCGEPGLSYAYSGRNAYETNGWHPGIQTLAERLSAEQDVVFNAAFCNLYRDGSDSIGWHADDERNLGPDWPNDVRIASVSLGATRRFRLRPIWVDAPAVTLELAAGDLLVMGGPLQRDWKHCIPKTARPVGERINLTFRVVQ